MYLVKSPLVLQLLYPSLIWKQSRAEKNIYLTFDDGPIPDVTEFVLKTLEKFNAKATFFCIGDNIIKHPNIFKAIKANGHSIGNHTFNHLKGWKTDTPTYLENTIKCEELTQTKLFRPPFGRIKYAQIRSLKKTFGKDFKIIMWDVLSGDYDQNTHPEQCLNNVIKHTENGSIVVFHDSLKAFNNLKYTLPLFLQHFKALGYNFKSL
ncbi:polysaccharide deacetylase family protein [Pedobacter flavus]|uniref:Polysaccharide deacetylase family protein n=1 Tax=Pedobacter flavus TaxID=3113906 RepID=A0ABU7H112_9SPHI|nr:polysaccharide deacetylase family protein [Pedobacter sp. VNH31]MEE1884931.1 polysaccharide deacetylase family protein [Pedobacter sp. VNH31]